MENYKPDLDALSEVHQDLASPVGPYIWQSKPSSEAGRGIVIMGAQHGNEVAGAQALEELFDIMRLIKKGSLTLILGNPAAYKKGARCIEEDMNRVWQRVAKASSATDPTISSPDAQRAYLIAPLLAQATHLFDLHTTIKKSDPMIVYPRNTIGSSKLSLLEEFDITDLLLGEGLLPDNWKPVYADSFMNRQKQPSFGCTVEAGHQAQQGLGSNLAISIKRLLGKLGMLDNTYSPDEKREHKKESFSIYPAYANLPYATGFEFEKDWENKAEISAGQCYARVDGEPLVAKCDSLIFFPKPQSLLNQGKVAIGDEVCILTKLPRTLRKEYPTVDLTAQSWR